jgi:hypothetical protein
MTAHISLIREKARGHKPRLQIMKGAIDVSYD